MSSIDFLQKGQKLEPQHFHPETLVCFQDNEQFAEKGPPGLRLGQEPPCLEFQVKIGSFQRKMINTIMRNLL